MHTCQEDARLLVCNVWVLVASSIRIKMQIVNMHINKYICEYIFLHFLVHLHCNKGMQTSVCQYKEIVGYPAGVLHM